MTIKGRLDADDSYWNATDQERGECCNGCGAKGGFNAPDTFYGLSMTAVCNIHDWDYKHGITHDDKRRADMRMLRNMLEVIENETSFMGRLLKPLRRRRALKYYEAVTAFGDKAFKAGKQISV